MLKKRWQNEATIFITICQEAPLRLLSWSVCLFFLSLSLSELSTITLFSGSDDQLFNSCLLSSDPIAALLWFWNWLKPRNVWTQWKFVAKTCRIGKKVAKGTSGKGASGAGEGSGSFCFYFATLVAGAVFLKCVCSFQKKNNRLWSSLNVALVEKTWKPSLCKISCRQSKSNLILMNSSSR